MSVQSSASWGGKTYAQVREVVQTALGSSVDLWQLKENLRQTVSGKLTLNQLTEICVDILDSGIATYSKGDDALKGKSKIDASRDVLGNEGSQCEVTYVSLTQKQSYLLWALTRRLKWTPQSDKLKDWLEADGVPIPKDYPEYNVTEDVAHSVETLTLHAETGKALLKSLETEMSFLRQGHSKCRHSKCLRYSFEWAHNSLVWAPDDAEMDEKREMLKRGMKHFEESGDLPGFIEKEKAIIAAEVEDADWIEVEAIDSAAAAAISIGQRLKQFFTQRSATDDTPVGKGREA